MLTIDIIRDIIEDMKPLLRFDSIEDVVVDEKWKLNGCNTYWLRACREIEIDGYTYLIDEVVFNESITISPLNGAPKPTILKFPIYAPSFFFGTRNAVNKDRVTEGNLDDSKGFDAITPFGFLLSRINETQPNDVDDPIDRNANIRLFFLEKYDLANEDTTNDNLLESVIRQLHVMADYFIAYVNDREDLFNMPEDITRRQYEAFSEVGVGNGWYLDDSLASVELEMTLPIRDTLSCDCKEQIDIKCAPAILYINGGEFKEIESGKVDRIQVLDTNGSEVGSKETENIWRVPQAGGGSADVENSDLTYTANVPSGDTLVLPDINVNANGNTLDVIPSVKDYDVTILDEDNNNIGTVETYLGNQIVRIPDNNDIVYNIIEAPKTYTSYGTGDAHWRVLNGDFIYPEQKGRLVRLVDHFTLVDNNIFGNTNRFTNEVGLQDYSNGVLIDHTTGLMYCIPNVAIRNWSDALILANTDSTAGYTDWKMPVSRELYPLAYRQSGSGLDYAPFTTLASWTGAPANVNDNVWTGETHEGNTGYVDFFYCNGSTLGSNLDYLFSAQVKTSSFRTILVRRHLI